MNNFNKYLGLFFTLFFGYATAVQFNDIDALFWVFIYAIATLVSLLFAFNKIKFIIPAILFLVYVGLAIYYWPDQFEGVALEDGMKTTNIEKGRESLGAAIGAIVMFVYAMRLRRKK